ncbi:MAG: hypothetical protein JW810_10620 [Sedimentisphaerales bacterium]|nr:hypothetical protein [Sedimentisphaerales bacterium]
MEPQPHTTEVIRSPQHVRPPAAEDARQTHCGQQACSRMDDAIVLLLQREETLLGDALQECNRLLAESGRQIEEIKTFLGGEE